MYVCYCSVIPYYIYTTTRFTSFAKVKVIIEAEEGIAVLFHLSLISGAKLIHFLHSAKRIPDFFCFSATKSYFLTPRSRRKVGILLHQVPPKSEPEEGVGEENCPTLRTKTFSSLNKSLFYGIYSYFQTEKIYFQSVKIYFQTVKKYFQSLKKVFEAVLGYFKSHIWMF